jgi:hypothetical protein
MKKTDLDSMTVTELRAFAHKKKVAISVGAKKADIVAALSPKQLSSRKAALKPAAAAKKAAAKPAAKKKAVTKKQAAPSVAKPVAKKKVATKAKTSAPKKVSAPKVKTPVKGKGTAASVKPHQAAPSMGVKVSAPRAKAKRTVIAVREWKLPPVAEEPLLAQERAADKKFFTGQTGKPATASAMRGERYGVNRIVLMTRDPFVVHAYWEVTPERLEREKSWFGWDGKLCIRLFDVTGVHFDGRNALGYFDQEVFDRSGSWYFDLGRPGHSFCAEVGLLAPSGRFLTLARSNAVIMPREGVSDSLDEEWMMQDEEFWKLYTGTRGGMSSREMQEMLKRRRLEEISSPTRRREEVSSPGMFPRGRAKGN